LPRFAGQKHPCIILGGRRQGRPAFKLFLILCVLQVRRSRTYNTRALFWVAANKQFSYGR
jgi:hypothetical protein